VGAGLVSRDRVAVGLYVAVQQRDERRPVSELRGRRPAVAVRVNTVRRFSVDTSGAAQQEDVIRLVLRQRARQAHDSGYIVILGGLCAGVTEMHAWLRGYENYYTDFHSQAVLSENIMDKVVDLKMAYWEVALSQAGEYVDVVMEADDMAGQERLLISPRTYRQFIKPRHARLFNFIKTKAPVKLFFHSCGAIRPLLGDLIETGIDIINPVQKSAAGMDLNELKNEFGKDLVFWGGGVDTQRVFSKGSSEQVREDVKRSIDALAPGGGFIFGTVHNTQADVSPENFMTMWETLQDYGGYR